MELGCSEAPEFRIQAKLAEPVQMFHTKRLKANVFTLKRYGFERHRESLRPEVQRLSFKLRRWTLASELDVKVHPKLERMRTHAQRLNFLFAFVGNPTVDELRTEDVAFQQEIVICFERL